jgi:hypothetical protein
MHHLFTSFIVPLGGGEGWRRRVFRVKNKSFFEMVEREIVIDQFSKRDLSAN